MIQRPEQIASILSQLGANADPCIEISREAASVREGQGMSAELVQACHDLDSAIQHMFQIGSYLMKATDPKGEQQ
jgi:hypothetical protein